MKAVVITVWIYLTGIVLTFGYAWNVHYDMPQPKYGTVEENRALYTTLSAFAWPLFWSAEAFKPLRPKP